MHFLMQCLLMSIKMKNGIDTGLYLFLVMLYRSMSTQTKKNYVISLRQSQLTFYFSCLIFI